MRSTRRYIQPQAHQGLADSVFNETFQGQASAPDTGNAVIPMAAGTTAPPSARERIAQWGGDQSMPVPQDTTKDAFLAAMVQKMKSFFRDAAVTASRPAHVDPNYWSTPLDISSSISVPAALMAPGLWTTITSFKVPNGSLARVQGYGVNVQDAAYTYNGSLIWRIQVDGNNVPNLFDFAQQRGSLVLPRQTFFVVPENKVISFQVRRNIVAGGAQTVEAGLFGWLWQPRNTYDNARNARVF
jgi:hypothetical protein